MRATRIPRRHRCDGSGAGPGAFPSSNHAARTWLRKASTRSRSCWDWADRVQPAARSTRATAASPVAAAALVTPATLDETSWVPLAACSTLRAISWVAAPCSSTAASDGSRSGRFRRSFCRWRRWRSRILGRALDGSDLAPISSVALEVWVARLDFRRDDREALAGFARPRRLDRGIEGQQVGLVGDVLIRATMSPIFLRHGGSRPWTIWLVLAGFRRLVRRSGWNGVTWRPISADGGRQSSAADATVCTLTDVSCAPAATAAALLVFSAAMLDIDEAVPRMVEIELRNAVTGAGRVRSNSQRQDVDGLLAAFLLATLGFLLDRRARRPSPRCRGRPGPSGPSRRLVGARECGNVDRLVAAGQAPHGGRHGGEGAGDAPARR